MKPITKERNKQNKEVGLVLEGGYPSLKNVEWINYICEDTWGLLKIQKVCVPHKGNGYSSHEVSRNFVDGFTYSAPR